MNKVKNIRVKIEGMKLDEIDKSNLLMILAMIESYYEDSYKINRLDGVQTIQIINDVMGRNLIDVCEARDIINEFASILGVTFTEASILYVKIDYKKEIGIKRERKIEEMLIPLFDSIGIHKAHGVDKHDKSIIYSWNLINSVKLNNDEELYDFTYKLGVLANTVQQYLDDKIENNPYHVDMTYPRCFLDIFTVAKLNSIVPLDI